MDELNINHVIKVMLAMDNSKEIQILAHNLGIKPGDYPELDSHYANLVNKQVFEKGYGIPALSDTPSPYETYQKYLDTTKKPL